MPRSGRRGREGHHGHHYGRHEHGGRGGGRERFFGQGELRLVMLHLLSEQPGSGYDVIRAVETRTGGRYTPSAGIVYPTLTLLQDLGHVSLEGSESSRNTYKVTASGSAYLTAYAPTLARLLAKMQEAQTNEDVVPDEVRAAVSDLKAAIRFRLRRSGRDAAGGLLVLLDDLIRRINETEGES